MKFLTSVSPGRTAKGHIDYGSLCLAASLTVSHFKTLASRLVLGTQCLNLFSHRATASELDSEDSSRSWTTKPAGNIAENRTSTEYPLQAVAENVG